jgi:hypothetical protein
MARTTAGSLGQLAWRIRALAAVDVTILNS